MRQGAGVGVAFCDKKPVLVSHVKQEIVFRMDTSKQTFRWRLAALLSLSFTISFMIFIHSPLEIYLNNPAAFVVGWRFLLPYLSFMFVISFAALSAVLLLAERKSSLPVIILLLAAGIFISILRFVFLALSTIYLYLMITVVLTIITWFFAKKYLKEKAFDIILLLMYGITIVAYMQVLFMNGSMSKVIGAQPGYSAISLNNILNLLIWVLLTITPLSIWIFMRFKKKVFK